MYKRWKTAIRIVAGITVTSTFIRVLHIFHLPFIFLLLPVSLCMLPWIFRYVPGLQDDNSRATITGVLTGVTAGFLSTVEHVSKMQVQMLNNANTELPQPPSDHRMPFSLALLQGLEIFHLPLLLFTIIHSFDRIFYRWPSTPSVVMAVITAFFADLTIVIFLVVLQTVDRPIQDIVSIFILIYGILLLFTLMPLFREAQCCWILNIICFALLVYWQTIYFGVAAWDFTINSYPVPGSLTCLVYIFHSPALDEKGPFDESETYPKQYDIVYNPIHKDSQVEKERVDTSIMWHIGAQVTERFTLVKMFSKTHHEGQDTFPACLTLLVLLFIFSSYYTGSRLKVTLCCIALVLLYWSVTLAGHSLHNSHHMDTMMGLILMHLSVPVAMPHLPRRTKYQHDMVSNSSKNV